MKPVTCNAQLHLAARPSSPILRLRVEYLQNGTRRRTAGWVTARVRSESPESPRREALILAEAPRREALLRDSARLGQPWLPAGFRSASMPASRLPAGFHSECWPAFAPAAGLLSLGT